jgi:hypothetical protein
MTPATKGVGPSPPHPIPDYVRGFAKIKNIYGLLGYSYWFRHNTNIVLGMTNMLDVSLYSYCTVGAVIIFLIFWPFYSKRLR